MEGKRPGPRAGGGGGGASQGGSPCFQGQWVRPSRQGEGSIARLLLALAPLRRHNSHDRFPYKSRSPASGIRWLLPNQKLGLTSTKKTASVLKCLRAHYNCSTAVAARPLGSCSWPFRPFYAWTTDCTALPQRRCASCGLCRCVFACEAHPIHGASVFPMALSVPSGVRYCLSLELLEASSISLHKAHTHTHITYGILVMAD